MCTQAVGEVFGQQTAQLTLYKQKTLQVTGADASQQLLHTKSLGLQKLADMLALSLEHGVCIWWVIDLHCTRSGSACDRAGLMQRSSMQLPLIWTWARSSTLRKQMELCGLSDRNCWRCLLPSLVLSVPVLLYVSLCAKLLSQLLSWLLFELLSFGPCGLFLGRGAYLARPSPLS